MKNTVLPGETLGEFVKRIREANKWSTRDVERQSGGEISNGYINLIETGNSKNPSPKKLKALAKGLRLDPEAFNPAIYQIAANSELSEKEQILLNEFRLMDSRGQSDVVKIVRALCNAPDRVEEVVQQPNSDQWGLDHKKTAKKPTKKVSPKLTK